MIVWQRLFGGRSATEAVETARVPEVLPLLPLTGSVTFPGAVLPFELERAADLELVDDAQKGDPLVLVVAIRDAAVGESQQANLHTAGTVGRIVKIEETATGRSILIHGIERREITAFVQDRPYIRVSTKPTPTERPDFPEKERELEKLRGLAMNVARRTPALREKAEQTIVSTDVAEHLTDFVTANIDIPVDEKQQVLATRDLQARMASAGLSLSKLLERLPPPLEPRAPECPLHGALASDSCQRCGNLACATCLGSAPDQRVCETCRRALKRSPNVPWPVRFWMKSTQTGAASVIDGWHVSDTDLFRYATNQTPPRKGAWAIQLGADLRSKKMVVGLAVAVAAIAAGYRLHQFLVSSIGLLVCAAYLRMLALAVAGLRDTPIRFGRFRVLAAHPVVPHMRVASVRVREGSEWTGMTVGIEAGAAESLLRDHPELDVLFLHHPGHQVQMGVAVRPTGPEIPADQLLPAGGARRTVADLALPVVVVGLVVAALTGGRPAQEDAPAWTSEAPMIVEAWLPIVRELKARGVSPELTVLALTSWQMDLADGEHVAGRFQRAIATTAVGIKTPTLELATRVLARLATAESAAAADDEARSLRPKLDGLPGVVKIGDFGSSEPRVLVARARNYAARYSVPLPHTEEPSPPWLALVRPLIESGTHDAAVLVLVTRQTQVTFASGDVLDGLTEEASLETVAAAMGTDITVLRSITYSRFMDEVAKVTDGKIPLFEAIDRTRLKVASLPGVTKAEHYVRRPPPPATKPFKPGDPIVPAPWVSRSEPPNSLAWRMGSGEDLMRRWDAFWRGLPTAERGRYLGDHPPPPPWGEWMTAQFEGRDAGE